VADCLPSDCLALFVYADYRVYRRNTFARRPAGGASAAADRSQTLPRGYGRHHTLNGVAVDRALSVAVTSSGTATLPRTAVPAPLRLSAVDLKRQSAPGLNGLGSVDSRGSRRSTSTTSMASVAYRGMNTNSIFHHTRLLTWCDSSP
jgi:hypothetical protein